MKKIFETFVLFMSSISFAYSAEYIGYLDNKKIYLSVAKDKLSAVYMYDKYKTPIELTYKKQVDERYIYIENYNDKPIAQLEITTSGDAVIGSWSDLINKKSYDVSMAIYSDYRGQLQSKSLKNYYFRVNCKNDKKEIYVIKKNDDLTKQVLKVSGKCYDDEIRIYDINFDGFNDFSTFNRNPIYYKESRFYFLFNRKLNSFERYKPLDDTSIRIRSEYKSICIDEYIDSDGSSLSNCYEWISGRLISLKPNCHLNYKPKTDIDYNYHDSNLCKKSF